MMCVSFRVLLKWVCCSQLVEAFRSKVGVPGFDFRWGARKFLGHPILLSAFSSPGVYSACNKEFPWG
jgi:hypothetical protein